MVQQNGHRQQLLMQEIHAQGSSGAETVQNSSFSPFYLLKNSPAFISRHTSHNATVRKRNSSDEGGLCEGFTLFKEGKKNKLVNINHAKSGIGEDFVTRTQQQQQE